MLNYKHETRLLSHLNLLLSAVFHVVSKNVFHDHKLAYILSCHFTSLAYSTLVIG